MQRNLAMHLTHATQSGLFQQNPINARTLALPNIAEDKPKFEVSEQWRKQLEETKATLQNALEQNNLSLRKKYFTAFREKLEEWKQINLVESPLWNHYYFPFFELWEKEAALKLEEINRKLQIEEPITANIYREGEALQPEDEMDERLFLGRQKVKDELATKILTARTIPLFLVQGQRRVGKTSLLKFLPRILDPSVFKVVEQDLQGIGHEPIRWMVDLFASEDRCVLGN